MNLKLIRRSLKVKVGKHIIVKFFMRSVFRKICLNYSVWKQWDSRIVLQDMNEQSREYGVNEEYKGKCFIRCFLWNQVQNEYLRKLRRSQKYRIMRKWIKCWLLIIVRKKWHVQRVENFQRNTKDNVQRKQFSINIIFSININSSNSILSYINSMNSSVSNGKMGLNTWFSCQVDSRKLLDDDLYCNIFNLYAFNRIELNDLNFDSSCCHNNHSYIVYYLHVRFQLNI